MPIGIAFLTDAHLLYEMIQMVMTSMELFNQGKKRILQKIDLSAPTTSLNSRMTVGPLWKLSIFHYIYDQKVCHKAHMYYASPKADMHNLGVDLDALLHHMTLEEDSTC